MTASNLSFAKNLQSYSKYHEPLSPKLTLTWLYIITKSSLYYIFNFLAPVSNLLAQIHTHKKFPNELGLQHPTFLCTSQEVTVWAQQIPENDLGPNSAGLQDRAQL